MEVILKQDVANLGFKDDIVTVKNGYGRNYLIPQGFAQLATPSAKKVLAENLKQRAFKEAKLIEEAKELSKKMLALDIKIPAKMGVGDKLFGSVSVVDLAEVLEKEGLGMERKYIKLANGSIKRIGRYEATIRLHREVVVSLPFEVIAEKA